MSTAPLRKSTRQRKTRVPLTSAPEKEDSRSSSSSSSDDSDDEETWDMRREKKQIHSDSNLEDSDSEKAGGSGGVSVADKNALKKRKRVRKNAMKTLEAGAKPKRKKKLVEKVNTKAQKKIPKTPPADGLPETKTLMSPVPTTPRTPTSNSRIDGLLEMMRNEAKRSHPDSESTDDQNVRKSESAKGPKIRDAEGDGRGLASGGTGESVMGIVNSARKKQIRRAGKKGSADGDDSAGPSTKKKKPTQGGTPGFDADKMCAKKPSDKQKAAVTKYAGPSELLAEEDAVQALLEMMNGVKPAAPKDASTPTGSSGLTRYDVAPVEPTEITATDKVFDGTAGQQQPVQQIVQNGSDHLTPKLPVPQVTVDASEPPRPQNPDPSGLPADKTDMSQIQMIPKTSSPHVEILSNVVVFGNSFSSALPASPLPTTPSFTHYKAYHRVAPPIISHCGNVYFFLNVPCCRKGENPAFYTKCLEDIGYNLVMKSVEPLLSVSSCSQGSRQFFPVFRIQNPEENRLFIRWLKKPGTDESIHRKNQETHGNNKSKFTFIVQYTNDVDVVVSIFLWKMFQNVKMCPFVEMRYGWEGTIKWKRGEMGTVLKLKDCFKPQNEMMIKDVYWSMSSDAKKTIRQAAFVLGVKKSYWIDPAPSTPSSANQVAPVSTTPESPAPATIPEAPLSATANTSPSTLPEDPNTRMPDPASL